MRLLCTGFHWLAAAANAAAERCDLVTIDAEAVAELWRAPCPEWWRAAVPDGWVPDVALIGCPEYSVVPPYLAQLPCPVALWVGDWYVNAQAVHFLADQVELVLADAMGVEALRRSGLDHVDELCPWTFNPERDKPDWDAEAEWDIGFMGNFNEAIQFKRNRLLWRVAQMDGRWRIRLSGGMFADDYARFLQRSRITFNYSVTGDINMRCFEAAACGSLVAIDRGAAAQTARWFEPGKEIIVYDEHNIEDVLEDYLMDEARRREMARAGWKRVQAYGPDQRLEQLLDRLAQLAAYGRTIRRPRDVARDGARCAAHLLTTPEAPALEGAELLLEEAERARPADARGHLSRAVLYARFGIDHPDQLSGAARWAAGHFTRAIELDPADATAWLAYVQFKETIGDPDLAELAERAIDGCRAGTLTARADGQLLARRVTARGVQWQETILAGPDPSARLTGLALLTLLELAARHERDPERRIALLEDALAACDPHAETIWALVETLLPEGRFADAFPWLKRLHSVQPLSADAWFLLVCTLVELARIDEAQAFIDVCERAAARLPVDASVVPLLRSRLELAAPRGDASTPASQLPAG